MLNGPALHNAISVPLQRMDGDAPPSGNGGEGMREFTETANNNDDDDDPMKTAAQRWPKPMDAPMRKQERIDNAVSDEEKRAFLDRLVMTPAQIAEAENTPQRTPAWFAFRRDRLSASLFGSAAGHNAKNETVESLLRKMLWSEPFGNAATEYGTALEGAAFHSTQAAVAMALTQRGFGTVWFEETGTRVFADHPWMCASADGIIHAVDGPGGATLRGVLELKAPYYKKAFYEPTPHYYYDQFSGQARIHNTDFIVFGIYTPEATQINYFERDATYWDDVLFPALRDFYMNQYLHRAILRNRGRIEFPNVDPHSCIIINPSVVARRERTEERRAIKAVQVADRQEQERVAAQERMDGLVAASVSIPDPWEAI